MEVVNATTVALIFGKLNDLFALHPANASVNRRRAVHLARLCTALNEFHSVPDGYCPFYFDQVSCWNATPPYTTARMHCVSWQFDRPNPDGYVELRCEDGEWIHPTGKQLVAMYRSCKLPTLDATVEWSRALAQLGYIMSTASLVVACAIFIYLRKLQCARNKIHFNLFLSLLMRSFFSIIQFAHSSILRAVAHTDSFRVSCKCITAMWNYLIVSSYFWIFIEGLYLHNIIYFNIFKEPSVWPYALSAWGVPLLICGCWTVVKILNDPSNCWLTMDMESQLILKIPLALITLLEVLVAFNILRQLYYKIKDDSLIYHTDKYGKLAKSTLYLICGTGVNFFIFDVALTIYDLFVVSPKIAHSAYVVINSFWGFFVSILYCFNSEEIANDWRLKKSNRKLAAMLRRELRGASPKCTHRKKSRLLTWLRVRSGCPECKLRKQLIESNVLVRSQANEATPDGTDTECSTAMNSATSTLRSNSRTVHNLHITQLDLCAEERLSQIDSEV